MSSEDIDSCGVQSHPVILKPSLEIYHLSAEVSKGQRRILGCTLSYHLGSRELVRCEYDREEADTIMQSPIFGDPVRIALRGSKSPGRERRLLRVALAAVPTTPEQETWLRFTDGALQRGLGLWYMEDGLPGLPLGGLWMPGNPQVLKPIQFGPNFEEELQEFYQACRPFFHRILYGDPSEEAERLLAEVPGIGGELNGGEYGEGPEV